MAMVVGKQPRRLEAFLSHWNGKAFLSFSNTFHGCLRASALGFQGHGQPLTVTVALSQPLWSVSSFTALTTPIVPKFQCHPHWGVEVLSCRGHNSPTSLCFLLIWKKKNIFNKTQMHKTIQMCDLMNYSKANTCVVTTRSRNGPLPLSWKPS